MESATVLRWLKQPGQSVRMGEALVELETDKAAIEVEAPADVTLAAIVAPEGTKLPIGGTLARLEPASGAVLAASAPAAKPATPSKSAPTPAAQRAAPAAAPAAQTGARQLASPLARRLAGTHGIDLARLSGSGPRGRVRKRDVLAAVEARGGTRPAAPAAPVTARAPASAIVEGFSAMRLGVAETVALSRRTIPSFSLDRWVETGAIEHARIAFGPGIERASGVRPTVTDYLLQAMADSLRAQPAMLDLWTEVEGRPRRVSPATIDIGLVVALEEGMMIPVLRDLGGKSLGEIARLRRDAVQRVRAGRLLASDSAPASIALSNLGRGGADRFDAIINPGQASILAVGREHERVIARGGAILVAKGFHITLSVDHRLIDGVRGAAFLGALAERIEFGPWTAE